MGDGDTILTGYITVQGKKYSFIGRRNIYKKEGERTPDWRLFPDDNYQPKQNAIADVDI